MNSAIINATAGSVSDNDTYDLQLSPTDVPGAIVAGGLAADESISIYRRPARGLAYVELKSGGTVKNLTADDNDYLIDSPGDYQFEFITASSTNDNDLTLGYYGGSN